MMAFLKTMAYYPHGSAMEALEFRVNHHFEVYGTCRWLTDLYRVNTKECILLALPCDKWQREVINGLLERTPQFEVLAKVIHTERFICSVRDWRASD